MRWLGILPSMRKSIPNRPLRCPMVLPQSPSLPTTPKKPPDDPTPPQTARDPRRRLLLLLLLLLLRITYSGCPWRVLCCPATTTTSHLGRASNTTTCASGASRWHLGEAQRGRVRARAPPAGSRLRGAGDPHPSARMVNSQAVKSTGGVGAQENAPTRRGGEA